MASSRNTRFKIAFPPHHYNLHMSSIFQNSCPQQPCDQKCSSWLWGLLITTASQTLPNKYSATIAKATPDSRNLLAWKRNSNPIQKLYLSYFLDIHRMKERNSGRSLWSKWPNTRIKKNLFTSVVCRDSESMAATMQRQYYEAWTPCHL